jgi:hypothetical protein
MNKDAVKMEGARIKISSRLKMRVLADIGHCG